MPRWLLWSLPAVAVAAALLWTSVLAPERVPVKVVAVERGRVESTVTNTKAGTVRARRRAQLSPQIGGRVVEIARREGDRVKRGDALIALDDASQLAQRDLAREGLRAVEASRREACIQRDRARRELERKRELANERILSPDLLDQLESAAEAAKATCSRFGAEVGRARAQLSATEVELEKMVMRAPFDGVIAELAVEVGEWVTPSPPMLTAPAVVDVIDPSSVYISAPMDEVDSAAIRAGLEAVATVDSLPDARCARYGGQNHVVDGSAERAADRLGLVQVEAQPPEPTVAADQPVERRLYGRAYRVTEQLCRRARAGLDHVAQALGVGHQAAQLLEGSARQSRLADDLVLHQLAGRGPRTRQVPDPLGIRCIRIGREQHLQQVGVGVLDQAVVGLQDHREATALEPLEDPAFPERTRAVQPLCHDARRHSLELREAPRSRQARVAQVVVEVEVLVVYPDGMSLERNPAERLAQPRHLVKTSRDPAADRLEVDAALDAAEPPGVEDLDRGRVRKGPRRLALEVGRVAIAESLVGVSRHAFLVGETVCGG